MSLLYGKGRAEQLAASDPAASAWVSANAGAGKTRVLVERVARLMLGGVPPERILCLTFTKAAAAEMANRLHATLGPWAAMPDDALVAELEKLGGAPKNLNLTGARRLFATAIEAPGGLKIQTIHAFAQALLRRFPREADLPPHFAVMDEREAQALLAELRESVLAAIGLGPEIAPHLDEDGFGALITEIAMRRGAIRRLIARAGGLVEAIGALRARLGLGAAEDVAAIDAELRAAAFDAPRAIRALEWGGPRDQSRALALRDFLTTGDIETYRGVFLTADDQILKNLCSKDAQKTDGGVLDLIKAEAMRVAALIARRKSAICAEATAAMLTLAEAMIARHETLKAARARLDFDDLIERAAHLLNGADAAAWVLYKLDGGIDHILVDEAQDTSPGQWTIVKALAQEFFAGSGARGAHRTVFAVGDEKQSIYSFQGADPEGFEHGRRHFEAKVLGAGGAFRKIPLDWSYRSTGEILNLVDKVFAGAAGAGVTLDGTPIRHFAARTEHGRVELWEPIRPSEPGPARPWDAPFDQDAETSPPRLLARRIAEKIAWWISDDGESLPTGKKIAPGDILILVRRRNVFVEDLIRELKQRRVPVSGADRMDLGEQIAVMDLLAAARAALLPEDDLNLAALLKSPLIDFDEIELFALAHGRPDSLWRALIEARGTHEIEAVSRIRDWRRASSQSPFEFFARILNAGGRRRLTARLGLEANDPINELLAAALVFERDENPTLQGFVHWIDRTRAEVKRDLDSGGDQVRIMTVHGAKGLEAPIVILPDTCGAPGGRREPRLVAIGGADDDGVPETLLYVPRRDFEDRTSAAARETLRQKQDAEHRRLLYVALTRARDWLYIAGYDGRRRRSERCWYDQVAPAVEALGTETQDETGARVWRIEQRSEIPPAAKPADKMADPLPLPDWASKPAPVEAAMRRLAPSHLPGADQPIYSPGGAPKRFQRGRLIHRLLQTLPDLPPSQRRGAAMRWLARSKGLDAAERYALVEETLAVIEHPEFSALFGPSSRAEVGIAGKLAPLGENNLLIGRVDRLAILPDCVIVADFKTNRPAPLLPDHVASLYVRQMAAYRAALREIYPDRPIRAVLIWTDGPRPMELDPSLLDRALVMTTTS